MYWHLKFVFVGWHLPNSTLFHYQNLALWRFSTQEKMLTQRIMLKVHMLLLTKGNIEVRFFFGNLIASWNVCAYTVQFFIKSDLVWWRWWYKFRFILFHFVSCYNIFFSLAWKVCMGSIKSKWVCHVTLMDQWLWVSNPFKLISLQMYYIYSCWQALQIVF